MNTHTFVFSLAVIIELVACKRFIDFLEILTDSGVIIGTANCGAEFHILVFAGVKNVFQMCPRCGVDRCVLYVSQTTPPDFSAERYNCEIPRRFSQSLDEANLYLP